MVKRVIKRGSAPPQEPRAPVPSRPARKKPIIDRRNVEATKEAARIVREAEDKANKIIEDAQDQAAQTRQHGFEEGKQEGLAQYTQQISSALLQVRKMEEDIEPSYVNLVVTCVEKIIGQELKANPEAIVGVVRNALIDARQQREIIVRVNPADVSALEKNQNKLLEILARANAVEIREDASITRGGCMVMTELGAIDAQLERQLEALATALGAELTESDYGGVEDSELDPEDDPGYGAY